MPFFVNFGYSRQGETKEAEMIDVHQNLAFVTGSPHIWLEYE